MDEWMMTNCSNLDGYFMVHACMTILFVAVWMDTFSLVDDDTIFVAIWMDTFFYGG
jgi:hypothetical protein